MIYGEIGETEGEKLVYHALEKLCNGNNDWIVYSQKAIITNERPRYPDFIIIHKDIGFIVLEVKDWNKVIDYDDKFALIRTNEGKDEQEQSPVYQARTACYLISDELKKHNECIGFKGNLAFPFRFAGVLPKLLDLHKLSELRSYWGPNNLLGYPDFKDGYVEASLRSIPAPFKTTLTNRQIDIIRSVIDPKLGLGNGGILDQTQEALAKEDINRPSSDPSTVRMQLSFDNASRLGMLEENLPEEVTKTSKTSSVRLIRGMAGTGKTDVIILRCHHLKETSPESRILVTTFNKPVSENRLTPLTKHLAPTVVHKRFGQICQDIFEQVNHQWIEPQGTIGVVNRILETDPRFSSFKDEYDAEFLANEILWMKETGLITKERYLNSIRAGQGGRPGGRSLSKNQKEAVFNFFFAYEKALDNLGVIDWSDLHHKALNWIRNGEVNNYPKYDEIIIDEAQHFAPKWIELMLLLLKENGRLYMCEDPGQSIYRAYSWKDKGVSVVGRTRWLRIPYRSTRQILKVAYSLIENNQTVLGLLKESINFELPDLTSEKLRDGEKPELHQFYTWASESVFIKQKVNELIQQGFRPEDIAILHTKRYFLDPFDECKKAGVIVGEVRRETGMEYKVVFIPKLNDFIQKNDIDDKKGVEKNQANLYTAITRAKDLVYLFYEQKEPKELYPLLSHVKLVKHNQ